MRTLLVLAGLFGAALAGCSKTVCAEAADKLRSCVESLDCSQIADPVDNEICQELVKNPPSLPEECSGANQRAAETLLRCTLDQLCSCNAPQPDSGGTADGPAPDISLFDLSSAFDSSSSFDAAAE